MQCRIETSGKHGVYWVHNDAPMRLEGQKTSSFEIAEQLVWAVPDWIVIPTSSGGNMSAHWKAWKELNCLGLVDGVPAMVVAQAEGCSPIVKAFREKKDKTSNFGEAKTIASAIANPDPPSGERVLKILKDSRGAAEAVSDDEILDAQERLAKTEGLFAEPAGAVSVAAMSRLISEGKMDKNDRIVCVITGSGLKDIKNAVRSSGEHAKVKSWDDYEKLIDGIFSGSPRSQRPLPWGSFAC